jgi:hypothetical protein
MNLTRGGLQGMSRKKIKGACEKHNIMYPTTRTGSEYKHKGRLVNEVLNNKKLTYQVFTQISPKIFKQSLAKRGWSEVENISNRPTLLHFDNIKKGAKGLNRFKSTLIKNQLERTGVYGTKDRLWRSAPPTLRRRIKSSIVVTSPDIHESRISLQYPLIVKPSQGGSGTGIRTVNTHKDLVSAVSHIINKLNSKSVIISEYIANPILFGGKKFHFRMHWIVAVYQRDKPQYKSWLHRLGFVYTAEAKYVQHDWRNKKIHDSHYGSTVGNIPSSKVKGFSSMFKQMCCIVTELKKMAKIAGVVPYSECKHGYVIHGVDFMVEIISGKPFVWLIEVNNHTGFKGFSNEQASSILNGVSSIAHAMATKTFHRLTDIPNFCQT